MANSSKWKKTLIVLVFIATIILFAGGWIFYSFEYEGMYWNCVWMSMQNCIQSLLFSPIILIQDFVTNEEFIDSLSSLEQIIMGLYSLALIIAPLVNILIIFSVLDGFLHLFVGFSTSKRRILLVGYNDDVRKLIEKNNKNGKIYLWTEHLLSEEEERELYLKKVSVKMNDFSLGDSPEEYLRHKNRFNKFIKKKKITDILLLDSSDIKNNQYYMTLSSCKICKKRTIHFFVLNKSFEVSNMLQDYFDNKLLEYTDVNGRIPLNTNTHMDLRIFNFEQIQARMLFSNLPIYLGKEQSVDKNVHLLIIGSNNLSLYIMLYAMNQAVLSSDNKIIIDIISDDMSQMKEKLCERFHKDFVINNGNDFEITPDNADGILKIRLLECDIMNNEFVPLLNKLSNDGSGQYTYIALCSNDINKNLHAFQTIGKEKIISEGNSVPIAIRMIYSKEMKEYLSSFGWCKEVYLMGENDEYIGLDQVINLEEEKYIRLFNSIYDATMNTRIFNGTKNIKYKGKRRCEKLWNKMEYYQRQSNRALYQHKFVKEAMFVGYEDEMRNFWKNTVAANEGNRALIWSLYLIEEGKYPRLLEMAKTEHRRFVYYHASEGWGYNSAKKLPKERMHDCLCNWKELSEKKADVLIYDLISVPLLMNDIKR